MATRRKKVRPILLTDKVSPLVRLWILRLLVKLDLASLLAESHAHELPLIVRSIGLGASKFPDDEDYSQPAVFAEIRKAHLGAEARSAQIKAPKTLRNNIARLKLLAGLSDIDCRILEFVTLCHTDHRLKEALVFLGQVSTEKVMHYAISAIIGIPEKKSASP